MKQFLAFFALLLVFFGYVAYSTVSNNLDSKRVGNLIENLEADACSSLPGRTEVLMRSDMSSIRRVGELDQACSSQTTTHLMYFTVMPKDNDVAKQLAQTIWTDLKEFDSYNITPIVVIEPTSDWGLIDFTEFNTGFWDVWINTFFSELKSRGVTDEQMGIWVPFPEANLPLWNHQNTSPRDYAKAVNRYLTILKKYFPDTETSILLNSTTYPTDDFEWSDGEYASLNPYVQDINKDLVDSFGLQGFPWMPPANRKGSPIFEPNEYLNLDIAVEAATTLGVKKIWFNTGSFASKYTQEPEKTVIVPAQVRKEIMEKTLKQLIKVKERGYEVSVNVFAEDKSQTAEATDWSYWGSTYTENNLHLQVILDFMKDAKKQNIDVWFFLR